MLTYCHRMLPQILDNMMSQNLQQQQHPTELGPMHQLSICFGLLVS